MTNKKVSFLVPIYPPHYHYARDLLTSFERLDLNKQSDMWFVFTSEEEKAEWGEYKQSVVLPPDLRNFDNRGIINIKKFYGLRQIQNSYEYVIVLDTESIFIKSIDLHSVCTEYFDKKILLGNESLSEGTVMTENIKKSCKRYFAGYADIEKLNNPLYLWFNQPCIYKTATLDDFFVQTGLDKTMRDLQYADFDYYIYMFYLILFQDFNIEDIEVLSNYGVCEAADEGSMVFKSNKYKTLPILLSSQAALHKFDNPKCFITIQLNQDKDRLMRLMIQMIEPCQHQISELNNRLQVATMEMCRLEAMFNAIFKSKIYRVSKKIYVFIRFIYRIFRKSGKSE